MSGYPSRIVTILLLTILVTGCYPTRPFYMNDRGDMSYYLDSATDIAYPDVNDVASLEEVTQAPRPITVIDPDFKSFMDLTLEQAVSIAMQNSKVLRGYGTPALQGARVAPGIDNLVNGPQAAGTLYNVAVRETEPGFIGTPGQISNPSNILTNTGLDVNQGVEAALADFDTQFTASAFWTTNDVPRNVAPGGNFLEPEVFQQDTVDWQAELAKKTANGTQIFFRNTNSWINNNNPLTTDVPPGLQELDSFYRMAFEVELRQPLLRGRGAFIQRMPVVISRIGSDQEIANLEAQLMNMVTNVEIRYWELYLAYRNLEAAQRGRDAALQTWRIVYDQFEEGADVNIQQVAQASEQYHFFDAQVIDSYNNLLAAESDLRWLLGIATTDCRIIRPIDEATLAPVEFDWCASLDEALCFRPELRQQRWEVKKRQLAVAYAKNSLLPQLDATALYRWLGLGDKYATDQTNLGFPNRPSGALNEIYSGDYQEFALGITYGIPIGLRRELSNVRNSQLKLARDVARIEDMELDVTRELSEAFRALDANRRIMQSSFNRWRDTEIEEEHFEAIVELGLETLDVALDAQRRNTQAAAAFYSALAEYNKVIALIHRYKGTILAYNGVHFAEGPWPGKAYQDASEYARRRGASKHLNYGWSRPQVISRGRITANDANSINTGVDFVAPQSVPTPAYPTVGPTIEGQYYDGGSVIYGTGEMIQGEIINATIEPTPVDGVSMEVNDSEPIVPHFVKQVSYEQELPTTQRTTRRPRPSADRNQPRRDQPAAAQRLPRKTVVATPVETPPESQNFGQAPSMNWESFGLSSPGLKGGAKVQANIKTK